jgi:L-lactate dehydrogenase complex protein LldG
MTARDDILQRLRHADASARLPLTSAPAALALPIVTSPQQRLERFVHEAAALTIECHLEATAGGVHSRLRTLVTGCRVLAWAPSQLPYDVGAMLEGTIPGDAPHAEQARADVGITACDGAIAETGSLVLLSGPGRSRIVSLLPPVHIAIVRRDQLVFTMAEFLAANTGRLQQAASCTFVTGPSRTADIELTLTLGIHGPGRVVVIIGP